MTFYFTKELLIILQESTLYDCHDFVCPLIYDQLLLLLLVVFNPKVYTESNLNWLWLSQKSLFLPPVITSWFTPVFHYLQLLSSCSFRAIPAPPQPPHFSTFLCIGVWEAPGGAAQASRQHQQTKEELHGSCARSQAQWVGQAPVYTLPIPLPGYQWSACAGCRWGESYHKKHQFLILWTKYIWYLTVWLK